MKNNYFGKTLKQLRTEEHLSQQQLGDKLKFSNQSVSFWETGKREPDYDTLVLIAKFFNVTSDFLLGIEE